MTETDFSGASCNRASDISSIVARMLRSRISREIAPETYGFLDTKEQLGRHVILLGLGGSYSYGTAGEGSDIDIRGVSLNRKSDLIGLTAHEQYEDENTDTVIFSFRKMITLLMSCNPNTLELLGLNRALFVQTGDTLLWRVRGRAA